MKHYRIVKIAKSWQIKTNGCKDAARLLTTLGRLIYKSRKAAKKEAKHLEWLRKKMT